MEDLTEVLNDVADGKASSAEAAEKIKELGRKGEEFMQRKATLNEGVSGEELMELGKKYSDGMSEALRKQMEAISRLAGSGRMTAELSEAIENMKSTKSSSAKAIEAAAESLLEKMK